VYQKRQPVLNLTGRWEVIHVVAFLATEGGGAFNEHMQPLQRSYPAGPGQLLGF